MNVPTHVMHGTGNAYGYYKCRCDLCRESQGVRAREYRLRNVERFNAQRRAEYAANPDRFNEQTKARYRKITSIINRYKLFCGCLACGYKKSSRALQFHHRNPAEKSFTVSIYQVKRSWKIVKAEIRKCDVLCANCHFELHDRWEAA